MRKKRKNSKIIDNEKYLTPNEDSYDDYFAYIAGYTSNGFPFGTTWEEEGISTEIPLEERIKQIEVKYEKQFDDHRWLYFNNDISMEDPKANVYIEDIANQIDMCTYEWQQFLNVKTGEFVSVPSVDNDYAEWEDYEEKLVEEIEESEDYLRLPDKYFVNEYDIMQNFASEVKDKIISSRLRQILHNRKPFRHFKDAINRYGIEKNYYAYRDNVLIEKAKQWCSCKGVKYKCKTCNEKK